MKHLKTREFRQDLATNIKLMEEGEILAINEKQFICLQPLIERLKEGQVVELMGIEVTMVDVLRPIKVPPAVTATLASNLTAAHLPAWATEIKGEFVEPEEKVYTQFCQKCRRGTDALLEHWENGEQYQVCDACKNPKKKPQ